MDSYDLGKTTLNNGTVVRTELVQDKLGGEQKVTFSIIVGDETITYDLTNKNDIDCLSRLLAAVSDASRAETRASNRNTSIRGSQIRKGVAFADQVLKTDNG